MTIYTRILPDTIKRIGTLWKNLHGKGTPVFGSCPGNKNGKGGKEYLYGYSKSCFLHNRRYRRIGNYIDAKHGDCEVYPAPFAVFINADDKNYVEPDISVICDKNKLDDRGCNGAPDWVIEIISPSTERMDYGIKLFKYRSAGVREYWIINLQSRIVNVYDFEYDERTGQYCFDDNISSCIYKDLNIKIADLL